MAGPQLELSINPGVPAPPPYRAPEPGWGRISQPARCVDPDWRERLAGAHTVPVGTTQA